MSSTSDQITTSTSLSSSSSSTADVYNFSIRETTIRNTAIAIGISLGVLLVVALIVIQSLRSKLKRIEKERDVYASKLSGFHRGNVSPGHLEAGRAEQMSELDGERMIVESDATPMIGRS